MHPGTLRSLGDYLLLGEIARGGMGVVYQAVHASLNRPCALKVIRAGTFASAEEKARFALEAEATATLEHRHIVRVRQAGEAAGQFFLEMELVEGGTLADRLRTGPLPPREAAALVARVARAVEHAHDRGVLHRDLKPGNVLLDEDGHPRLTDFGLARLLDRESDLTRTVTVLGTPAYLAPELAAGQASAATTAADVYGLGTILYECLTGQAPYAGETPLAVLKAVQEGPPAGPLRLRPGLPRDLGIVVERAMAREPAERLSSAREMADELERWLRGEPIRSRPVPWWEALWAWMRRRPALSVVSLAALGSLGLGVATATWQWRRAEVAVMRLSAELTRAENRHAELLFEGGEAREAMARLAATLRRDPEDALSAVRLAAALTQRGWARPVAELGPHEGEVVKADWSPDGERVVTADGGGFLRVWDMTREGAPAGVWSHGPEECYWLAWSADGRWFGSRLETGSLRVWSREASGPVLAFEPGESGVRGAAFAPAGGSLAVVRADHAVEVWDPEARRRLWRQVHPGAVRAAEFTRDARWLATVDEAGAVRVFDAATGEALGEPRRAGGALRGASWHPDGRRLGLSTETNGIVELWDGLAGTRLGVLRHGGTVPAQFTPGGLLLRYEPASRVLVATDPDTLVDRYRVEGIDGTLLEWWVSREGRHGAVLRDGLNLLPFDAEMGAPLAEPIRTRWAIEWVALHPGGTRMVVAAGAGRSTVWEIAAEPADATRARGIPGEVLALGFAPDRRAVWTCDRGGVLRTAGLPGPGAWTERPLPRGDLARAAFSPDARRLAVVDRRHELEVFDAATAASVAGPWALPGEAAELAFAGSGPGLVVGTVPEEVVWFDVGSRREMGRVDLRPGAPAAGYGSRVQSLEYSPDGTVLAVATYGGLAVLVETGSGRVRSRWPHPAPVRAVRFSGDGRRVGAACADGSVRVWEVAAGSPVGSPMLHEDEVRDLRFTPDGGRVVTVGADRSLRVWEVGTGRQLIRVSLADQPYQVAVGPSGAWASVAMRGRFTRIWDLATGLPWSEPVPVGRGGNRVVAAPGGDWVGVWERGGGGSLVPVIRPPSGPVPAWLPAVAEAAAERRFGSRGEIQSVPTGEAIALAARLRGEREGDPYWAAVLRRYLGEVR